MGVIRGFWKSGRISRTIGSRLGIISVVCVVSLCLSFTVSENVENGSNTTSVSKGPSGPSAPSGPSGPSGPSLLTTSFASMKNITFKMLGIKQKPKGRNGKKITAKKVTTVPSSTSASSTSTSTGKVVKATPSISTTTVTPLRLQAPSKVKFPPRIKEGKKVEVIPDQMMSGSDDVYMAAAPPSASLSNEFRHADSMAMESGGRSSQIPPDMSFPMNFQKFGVKDSLLYRTEVGSVIARRSSKGSGRSGTSGSGHFVPDKPTTPPPASHLATTFQNSGGFNPNSKGSSYKFRAGSSAPQPTSGGAYGYPNGGGLHEIDPFGSASSKKSFNPSPGPGHISTFTSPSKAFRSISENFDNWQPSMNSGASEGDRRTGNDPLSKLIKKKAQAQKDEEPSTSHSSMNQGFSIPSADLNYQPVGESEGGVPPESNESFLGSFKTEGMPNLDSPKEQSPLEFNDESGPQNSPNSEGESFPEGYHGFIPESPLGDFGSRIPENNPLGLGEGPGSDGFQGFGSGGPSTEDGSQGPEGRPQTPDNFHNFEAGTPPIQEVSNDVREESSEGYVPPTKNVDEGFHINTKISSSPQLSGPGKSESHPQRRRKPAVLRQPSNQQQTSSSTASHSSTSTNRDQSQNFGDFGGFQGSSIPNAENTPEQELENFMDAKSPQNEGNKEESPQNQQQFTTPQSVPTIRGQGSPFQETRGPQLGAGAHSTNSYQNGPPPQYQHQPRTPQGFGGFSGNFPHSQTSHVPNGGFGGNFNTIQNTQGPQNFGGNSGNFQHSQHSQGPNVGGFPEHFQPPQQSQGQPGFGGPPPGYDGFRGNFNPAQNSQGQPGFGGNFNPPQSSQGQPGFGGNFNPAQSSQGQPGFRPGPSFRQPHNTQPQSFTAGFGGFPNPINNAPPPQHISSGGPGFGSFPSFNSHPQHHPGQFNGFHSPASHSASAESVSQSSENEPGQQGAPPQFINGNPSNFGKMFSQGNAIQSKLQQHSQGVPSFSPEGNQQGPPQPPQFHQPPPSPQIPHSQSQGFQAHSPPQGSQHSQSHGFQAHSPPQGSQHSQSHGFQAHSPPQGSQHSQSHGFQAHSPDQRPQHSHPQSQGSQAHHPALSQFGNSQSQGFQSHPPPAPQDQQFNSQSTGGPTNHPHGHSFQSQSQGPKSLGGFSNINSVQPYHAHSTPSTPHNKQHHQPDFKNLANQQSEGKGFQNFGKFPGEFADSVLKPTASPLPPQANSNNGFTNFNPGFNTHSRQSHPPQQPNFPAPPPQANLGNDGSFEDTQGSFSSESSVSVEHGSPGFTGQSFSGFQHENSPLQGQHTPQQGQGPNIQIGNHALDAQNNGFGPGGGDGNPAGDLRFNQGSHGIPSAPGPSFAPGGGNIAGIMSGNPEGIGSPGPVEHYPSGGNVAGFMSGNPEGFGPNGPISSHPGGGGGGGNVAGFMSGNLGGFGPVAHHPGGGNVGGVMSGNLGGFAPLGPLANLPGGPLALGGPNDGGIEGSDSHGDEGPGPGGFHHGGGFNNHGFFAPSIPPAKNPFFGALGKLAKGPLFGLGGLLKGLGVNKHKNTKLSVKEKLKFPFEKAFKTILALVEKKLAFFAKFAIPKDHYLRVIGFVGVYLLFAWLYKDNEHLFQAKCENWGWNGPEEFTFHAPPYFVPALPVDPHMQREFLELFRGVEGCLDKKKEGDDKKKKKKKKHKKGKGHKNKHNGRSDGSSEEEEDDRSLEAYDDEINFINDMCPRTQFFFSFSPYHIEAWSGMARLFAAQKTPADILNLARALLHDHSVNPKVWYIGLKAAAQLRPDMTGFILPHPLDAIPDWFVPGHLIEGEMDRYRGLPRQKRSTFFLRDGNGTIIFVTPPDLAAVYPQGELGTTTATTTTTTTTTRALLTSTPTTATTTRPLNVVNVTAAVLLERGYATNVNGTFDNGTSTLLRRRGEFTDENDDDEFDEEDDDDDDEGHNQREKNPLGHGFGLIGEAFGKIKDTFQKLGHGDGDGDGDKKKGKGHKGKGKGKKGKKKKKDKKKCIIVDGSVGLDNGPENKLWYWREDIMLNQHHWYWHAVYPLNATVHGDRRAELFFFMHRSFLARYNAERLSNGFARTAELGMFPGSIIEEGYHPHLKDVHSGKYWTPRAPQTPLTDVIHMEDPDFARDIIVTDWIALYNKFLLAIKLGKLLTAKGKFLPIRFHQGLDPLANTIEATNISVNPLYYDAFGLHNLGHFMIALAADPNYKKQLPTGVMSETATAMRDPSFYTYHTVIDNLFEKFKLTLQPYRPYGSVWPLQWHGVDIADLKVLSPGHDGPNHLTTFYIKHKFLLEPGVDRSIEKGIDKADICAVHLDHAPFKFQITIDRKKCAKSKSGQGTVRLFMAPRYDEHGERLPYAEQRRLMFQLDAFQVDLKVGRNVITRNSIDNSLTKPWSRSLREYMRGPDPSGAADYCGCGWPIHLFIPKGNTKGMPYDLFAMVTNFDEDFVADNPADLEFPETCNSPYIFCGRPRRLYPDARPMGYPFDRASYRVPVQHCGPGLTLKDLLCKIAGKFFTRPVATLEEYVSGASNMAMTVLEIKHIPKVVGKHHG